MYLGWVWQSIKPGKTVWPCKSIAAGLVTSAWSPIQLTFPWSIVMADAKLVASVPTKILALVNVVDIKNKTSLFVFDYILNINGTATIIL